MTHLIVIFLGFLVFTGTLLAFSKTALRVSVLCVVFGGLSAVSAAPHHQQKKHGLRIPGVVNAATYPGRHPVKTVKPFYNAGKRILW